MNKKKKILITIFKATVIVLSYFYIVNRLSAFDFSSFSNINLSFFYLFFTVFGLMIVNWSLEAFKWQKLVNRVEKTTFYESFKAVLVGLIFGLFTPNRIGEIGGRSINLKSGNKVKGVVAASVGSYAQMTVTVVLGLFGFGAIFFFFGAFGLNVESLKVVGIVLIFLAIVMLVGFFRLDFFIKILKFFKLSSKYIDKINIISEYPKVLLIKTLIISVLRYVVFVFQYYLLLRLFGVDIEFFIAIAGILSVFLLMNLLPNVVIADLGIRGSISIFVLGQFAENLQGILAASILLWMINILVPAILGQILFLKTKSKNEKLII